MPFYFWLVIPIIQGSKFMIKTKVGEHIVSDQPKEVGKDYSDGGTGADGGKKDVAGGGGGDGGDSSWEDVDMDIAANVTTQNKTDNMKIAETTTSNPKTKNDKNSKTHTENNNTNANETGNDYSDPGADPSGAPGRCKEGKPHHKEVLGCGGEMNIECPDNCINIHKCSFECKANDKDNNDKHLEKAKAACQGRKSCKLEFNEETFGKVTGCEPKEYKMSLDYSCEGTHKYSYSFKCKGSGGGNKWSSSSSWNSGSSGANSGSSGGG